MKHLLRLLSVLCLGLPALAIAAPNTTAGSWRTLASSDWCDDSRVGRGETRHSWCEVREIRLPARPSLSADGGTNGGIQVEAWDRDEVLVQAKVEAWAPTEAEAKRLVARIEIRSDGTIEARDPDANPDADRPRLGWGVSYRISVPRHTDLDLVAHNGGLNASGIEGDLRLETLNGGLGLSDLAGNVRATTTNGGISVRLTGSRWDGASLDARTTNGSVVLYVPDGYSAQLETGTRNGQMNVDIPVQLSGRLSKRISTSIGRGGPPVSAVTTNGSVAVRRAR